MNFHGGGGFGGSLGAHGLMGTPFGAGRYPFPMSPMPLMMGGMGGMGGCGGLGGLGGMGGMAGLGALGGLGGAGLGGLGMGGINPMMLALLLGGGAGGVGAEWEEDGDEADPFMVAWKNAQNGGGRSSLSSTLSFCAESRAFKSAFELVATSTPASIGADGVADEDAATNGCMLTRCSQG